MKRYQIALLFFALGIFVVTSMAIFLNKEKPGEVTTSEEPEKEFKTISVFFPNVQNDPEALDCETTYPVERVLGRMTDNKKSALGEFAYLAVADLLKGPTEQEKVQGFFTSINDGTRVQRVIIESGVAHVDFNDRLNEGVALLRQGSEGQAGSCKVQAIRSQITETLTQFLEIKEVVISVNGRTEDILQP
ncbi:MAG: GerMN domain-containing protein [Candidatus Taylorbacteria bacterium]|nr:GerMN domain-containing protein [Candidatus Taylorbacteria bacterium]